MAFGSGSWSTSLTRDFGTRSRFRYRKNGGIEGFLRREVLPYAEDAWYVPKSVKIGYEISFNRYFYKPEPMRTLEEIRAEITAVERESEGLLTTLLVREPMLTYGKLRVYADTSVIGGCEDEEFREPSCRLIERCMRGEVTLVVSDVTAGELRQAPPPVREVLPSIGPEHLERIDLTREVEKLANEYMDSGALDVNMRADALHIAAATVASVDVLASWNFRHMVNSPPDPPIQRGEPPNGISSVGHSHPRGAWK